MKNSKNKESLKKKNKIVERFAKKNSFIDDLLLYLPFFVRWPIQFFLWVLIKGMSNPLYLLGLFALFTIIKRVVKNNTYEWSNYATNDDQ